MENVKGIKFSYGRPEKYPWDVILNGETWRLIHGDDFEISASSFRMSVINKARTRGIIVKTQIEGNDVIVQALSEAVTSDSGDD